MRYPNESKANTEEFLTSYLIQREMGEASGFDEKDPMATSKSIQLNDCNPYDTELKLGQIRIQPQVGFVTFVLLFEQTEDGYNVMPFSHYDSPATNEEFCLYEHGKMYEKTLQAWNVHFMSNETLQKGWVIREIAKEDLQLVCDFQKAIKNKSVSSEMMKRSGLPLRVENCDDIRWQYIDEEFALFEEVDKISKAQKNKGWSIDLPLLWETETVLAAGNEEKAKSAECSIGETDDTANIRFLKGELKLYLFTAAGDKNDLYNGFSVIDEKGTVLGPISNGKFVVKGLDAFSGKCALRSPEGKIIYLVPKKE